MFSVSATGIFYLTVRPVFHYGEFCSPSRNSGECGVLLHLGSYYLYHGAVNDCSGVPPNFLSTRAASRADTTLVGEVLTLSGMDSSLGPSHYTCSTGVCIVTICSLAEKTLPHFHVQGHMFPRM